jgi:DNA-binding transcriptional MerR regulator
LQQLGFTLEEVIDALHANDRGTASCDSERWRLQAVLARIDTKIAELREVRRDVLTVMDAYASGACVFDESGGSSATS